MGWRRGRDDVARVERAVDLKGAGPVMPEPGKVRAEDRVDLVLDAVEVTRSR